MALTSQQLATLKADILADPTLSAHAAEKSYGLITAAYNSPASPAWTVWRTLVTITETGRQFVGSEWAGMTSANHTRLQTVAQWLAAGYDASKSDIRAMFDDIWSGAGGANTRTRLLALWKRTATRAEKLLSTGTGSDALPATLGFEGNISDADVEAALR